MSGYDNYNSYGSGYTTPEFEINQHHNPIPALYHNQASQHPHIPSPPLSDILLPTQAYPVAPPSSYNLPVHGHHVNHQAQYAQQANPISRGLVISPVGRRRSSPDDHVESPVQTRRQHALSARRDPHPYYPKRRAHVQISDDDDDELGDLPPNATDQQKIEHQRHRNTLAARRSRKRKELYKQELEQKVEQLQMETEKWRTRAEMLRRLIEGQGLGLCPDWSE